MDGHGQGAGGNRQFINPTINSHSNTINFNNEVFYFENVHSHGNVTHTSGRHFHFNLDDQPPHVQQATRQNVQHILHSVQNILGSQPWMSQPSPASGQSAPVGASQPEPLQSRQPQPSERLQSRPSELVDCPQTSSSQRPDEQPPHRTPGCSGCFDTRRGFETPESSDSESEYTERRPSVKIIDNNNHVLQPGDVVIIGSLYGTQADARYWSIYIGDRNIVHCRQDTQTVVMETLDWTKPFQRAKVGSNGRATMYPLLDRSQRADFYIGSPPPLVERWRGLDFVYWTLTGLNCEEAMKKGFYVKP